MLTQPSLPARGVPPWFVAMLACVSLTAGCALRGPQPGTPATSATAIGDGALPPLRVPVDAVRYEVDPERTVVTVIVRRAGPLARLGHDHVVTSNNETGTAWLGNTPESSVFELRLPVGQFDVDLAEARAAAGPEFAPAVPEAARAGTRQNLLRPEVLDAQRYPILTLRSSRASGTWPNVTAKVAVEIKGRVSEIDVPVHVEREAGVLTARGALQLSQSQLGLTPFSAAGGAIQVADVLEVRFALVATTKPGN